MNREDVEVKIPIRVLSISLGLAAAVSGSALANQELAKLSADPNNWAMQAGDFANHRYSELKQINAGNVNKLQVAWMFSTGVLRGHEGSPLVIGDTMYLVTPFPNNVFALDLETQKIKWKYAPKQDPAVIPQMCCDTVNRGVAYADGKVFLQQADSTLVALDAKSGKVVWSVKNGDPKVGAVNTNAPHIFKDKVITGISGGEWGVRGYLSAYDIKTGKMVWRGYSTGPDSEMLIDPNTTTTWTDGAVKPVGADSSLKTWKGDQWKIGGGTTWGWYSYDPDLNLLYYGTGNPSTWNPSQRPGDNKWSMSVWARDVDTGKVKWVYQMTPYDEWDFDGINEMILADINVGGAAKKVLVHFDRNGFGYTIDRTNGALLVAQKFDPAVNWATQVDMKTGRAVRFPVQHRKRADVSKGVCSGRAGIEGRAASRFQPERSSCSTCRLTTCMD
jgi:PQQ-dependent dehydrogenase (methanol/ethanol family)